MTLKELISEVKLTLKWDESDIEYDDRIIIRFLNSQRALFIKNEINKGNLLTHSVYQTISSLPLVLVSGTMSPYFVSDKKFLTSKAKLPRIIEVKGDLLVRSLRVPELAGRELNQLLPEKIKVAGNGKFNTGEIFSTFYRDRVFIKDSCVNKDIQNLSEVTIDAVFENPLKLSEFVNSDGTPAYDVEKDHYPINDTLWEYMIGAIRKNRYQLLEQTREAEANNDTDNS